jgi:hypothetical protein
MYCFPRGLQQLRLMSAKVEGSVRSKHFEDVKASVYPLSTDLFHEPRTQQHQELQIELSSQLLPQPAMLWTALAAAATMTITMRKMMRCTYKFLTLHARYITGWG